MDESMDGYLMAQLIAGTSQAPCPQGEEVGAAGLALWSLIGLIGVYLKGAEAWWPTKGSCRRRSQVTLSSLLPNPLTDLFFSSPPTEIRSHAISLLFIQQLWSNIPFWGISLTQRMENTNKLPS